MAIELGDFENRVAPYLDLMRKLLSGALSSAQFNDVYQARYLNDPTMWPDEIFLVLDKVFAMAESLVVDPLVRPQILMSRSPEELEACVREALAQLDPAPPL